MLGRHRMTPIARNATQKPREHDMPLVDIQLIEGVFDADQKREMIEAVTDTMVRIEGEALRGLTWVRVHEIPGGAWGIGGKPMTAADVKSAAAQGA